MVITDETDRLEVPLSLADKIVMLLNGLTIREAKRALEDAQEVLLRSRITFPPQPLKGQAVDESSHE